MHGVVSSVALVSFSAASIRARALCSAVTSSSCAANTGWGPLISIATEMLTRVPGRTESPVSACQPSRSPASIWAMLERTRAGFSRIRSR